MRGTTITFGLSPFNEHGLSEGGEEKGRLRLLLSVQAFLVCTPPLRVILNSSTKTPSGSIAFPFANERMASASSCIEV